MRISSTGIILRGGTVVDGTAAPRRRADVRIENGRIVDVGDVDPSDAEIYDVSGLFVAPGFIDPHTHLDAQLLWDPDVTPSSWHGVTSVIIGNCGFGLAPTKPADRDLVARILENVEGMPLEALQAGIDWRFETFPEYLSALHASRHRVNVGALVGHTPLRVYVMGREANERAATTHEVEQMCSLLDEAIEAGAVGFATSRARNHQGAFGGPVPSRMADRIELDALLGTLARADRGIFQVVAGPDFEAPEDFARVAASGTPVTWTPFFANGSTAATLDETKALGGEVWPQMACRPIVTQVRMANPALFYSLPSFSEVLAQPVEGRANVYRDETWQAGRG